MRVITWDAETFYSQTHSLSKLNPIEYIQHPETEIISLAVKVDDEETFVIFGEDEVGDWVRSENFSDAMVVGHNNSGFDAPLMAWRFGVKPKLWGCTQSMSRPFFQSTIGVSLKAVAEKLGLGQKGSLEEVNAIGKHLCDFTEDEVNKMRVYNALDAELCYGIFKTLAPHTTKQGIKLIDMTVRLLTEPLFEIDKPLLQKTITSEAERLERGLEKLRSMIGAVSTADVKKTLASSKKFSNLLTEMGVETPLKPSPKVPGKMIPALAKTDQGLIDLTEHENEIVATAATTRLEVKSTMLATRAATFVKVGEYMNGKMPVALNYYGATTGRWSGAFKMNQQNLPRIDPKKPKPSDALRNSLKAPKGHKVVVVDLSGIELRINHTLWKVPSSMALFSADPGGADLYRDYAAERYNKSIKEVTKNERQIGKVAHLGLGFNAAAPTFKRFAKVQGGIILTDEEAEDIVLDWRRKYIEIVRGWKTCQSALSYIHSGIEGREIDPWGLCRTTKNGIETPIGYIRYPGLRREKNKDGKIEWVYGYGRGRSRVYGGLADENMVQHLGYGIMGECATTINKEFKMALTVHDEGACVVPDSVADECLAFMLETMRTPPKWWPELVVWAEGGISDTYGGAK